MRSLLLIGVSLLISGCSQPYMTTIYPDDKQMVLKDRAVGLPMPFYDLSMKSQDYPRCHKKGFCSLFPEFREGDFKKMNHPWNMMTDENGYSVGLAHTGTDKGVYLAYDIDFSTNISPYTERESALERGDEAYIQQQYHSYVGREYSGGDIVRTPMHIEHHGKENYPCTASESYRPIGKGWKTETYFKNIACSKFDPKRTMTKEVNINLIYTRAPNLPKELKLLANEYTYEDLQQRAQRVLDSLYIKDGWEK